MYQVAQFSYFNAKIEQNTNVYHQLMVFVASCFSALVELINNSPLQKVTPLLFSNESSGHIWALQYVRWQYSQENIFAYSNEC